MSVPRMLFGIDLVDVRRVARALDRNGVVYARHVLAEDEQCLHTDRTLATAAGVAVKEGFVKAVGGRPPGFSWHDFVAQGPGGSPALIDRSLAGALPPIAAATGIELTEVRTYTVRGASRDAALARLGEAPGETSVVGAARWGRRHEVIVALAILVTISAKENS
ncbi:phosphopantetheinyl transferase [Saccharomonospora xinjiangensis]|uniref:phosphopantetheinyl transferase n=1 Tax=Saccharomonospora xinjiangensis TaxID=75294 RepID=UPI001FFC5580|nr:phosphopantetheinyl transferase [Saccharomonospora xinjiangensis]